jgi:hypothetical protein
VVVSTFPRYGCPEGLWGTARLSVLSEDDRNSEQPPWYFEDYLFLIIEATLARLDSVLEDCFAEVYKKCRVVAGRRAEAERPVALT